MDSVAVTVPLRPPTKKMKKRKELDALAPSHVVSRRTSGKRSSQELLSDSSDERSEYWNIQMRGNRKVRTRRHRPCPGLLRACSVFFACATILATASLIWLFIDVRQQLTTLRTDLDKAVAGSESLPDALQKCHSDFKKLEKNQTAVSIHLAEIDKQITNISLKLAQMQDGFGKMQSKLKSAPELTTMPTQLQNLASSVASLGSNIRDIQSTIDNLKSSNNKLLEVRDTLTKNITDIQNTLSNLANITQRPEITTNETKIKTEELSQSIAQLRTDLVGINETLTRNLTWVQSDQQKDHNLLNSLQDKTQNAITKVMSLEGECAKATEQSKIVESVKKLTDDLTGVQASSAEIKTKLAQLEESYSQINNSTNVILKTIASTKTISPTARSQPDDSTQATSLQLPN